MRRHCSRPRGFGSQRQLGFVQLRLSYLERKRQLQRVLAISIMERIGIMKPRTLPASFARLNHLGVVPTNCCPAGLPTLLFVTISGGDFDGVYPLGWAGYEWVGTIRNPRDILFSCGKAAPPGPATFTLRVMGEEVPISPVGPCDACEWDSAASEVPTYSVSR